MLYLKTLCILCALGGSFSLAQPYRCDWAVVGAGGGVMSNGNYRVGATAGQTAAGLMTGPQYRAFIGFWQAELLVGVRERTEPVLPAGYVTRLEAIAPNPAPGRAQVRYSLAAAGSVLLAVHDLAGRRVRTLVDGPGLPGRHTVAWRGDDDAGRQLANGIYFCRFSAGEVRQVSKLVLAR